MTPEQAAEKFILCNGLEDFECTEALTKELISLIKSQRAEAVAEAQKWRPIETAPKDATFPAFSRPISDRF